ncbi:MAG TPA: DUF1805 domain-containing protein [Elusimicrobiota bacterium]|nr:DUF1805 domain-containing protein [Elusimicrobiota bacterium]
MKKHISSGKDIRHKIDLPGAPLLLIQAEKGYVMCGYLDIRTAEKLGQAAAIVRGVKDFSQFLDAPITEATPAALRLGVQIGMTARAALERLNP